MRQTAIRRPALLQTWRPHEAFSLLRRVNGAPPNVDRAWRCDAPPAWLPSAPATTLAQTATGAAKVSTERIAEILASPDRSAADRTNDIRRKPAQMLAFIGIVPGMVAMDLSSGGGYTTELLARAVGPTGRVYGQSAAA